MGKEDPKYAGTELRPVYEDREAKATVAVQIGWQSKVDGTEYPLDEGTPEYEREKATRPKKAKKDEGGEQA